VTINVYPAHLTSASSRIPRNQETGAEDDPMWWPL